MTIAYNVLLRNAKLDAITAFAGAGARLRLYDGARPATGGAVTTLLAEATLGTPFAPAASAGMLLPALAETTVGLVTGVASWFRITKDDDTHVIDGSVGIASTGADLVLNTPYIAVGVALSLSAFTIACGNP